MQRLALDGEWMPEYFEFSFGLNDDGRDPRSLADPVTVDSRFVLRGSVDLIERKRDGKALRVTDHKTGRNRSKPESGDWRRHGPAAGALQRGRGEGARAYQ